MDCHAAANNDAPNSSSADDRRIRRMISNRESARRSRMRKQRHLEDLRRRVSRLRLVNCALTNRIASFSSRCALVRQENELLKSEFSDLRRRISEIHRLLLLRQLDRLSSPSALSSVISAAGCITGSEKILASLMA